MDSGQIRVLLTGQQSVWIWVDFRGSLIANVVREALRVRVDPDQLPVVIMTLLSEALRVGLGERIPPWYGMRLMGEPWIPAHPTITVDTTKDLVGIGNDPTTPTRLLSRNEFLRRGVALFHRWEAGRVLSRSRARNRRST